MPLPNKPDLRSRSSVAELRNVPRSIERGAEIGAGPIARLWRHALLLASQLAAGIPIPIQLAKYQPECSLDTSASSTPRTCRASAPHGNAEGFPTRPSLATLSRHGKEPAAGALERAGEEYVAEVTANIPEEPDALTEALSVEGLPEQVRVRGKEVVTLRAQGMDPYPVTFRGPIPRRRSEPRLASFRPTRTPVASCRPLAVSFSIGMAESSASPPLHDGTGDLQIMIALDAVGADMLRHWRQDVDLGDHVGVTGEVITTKRAVN